MKEQQVLIDIFLEAITLGRTRGGGGGVVATLHKVLLLFS